jgi:hypothetical protein
VWESYEALHAFVYRSPHGGHLRRRARTLRRRFGPDGRPVARRGLSRR